MKNLSSECRKFNISSYAEFLDKFDLNRIYEKKYPNQDKEELVSSMGSYNMIQEMLNYLKQIKYDNDVFTKFRLELTDDYNDDILFLLTLYK